MRIYDALKNLMIPELLQSASGVLREDETKVVKAAHAILPALMGAIIKECPSAKIKEVVELAGKNQVANHLDKVFDGSGIFNDLNIGERFENAIIGPKNTKFREAVAKYSGLKVEHADRLTNWVSLVIAGYFGSELFHKNETCEQLMKRLKDEKGDFVHDIPATLVTLLGLGSIVGAHKTQAHTAAHHAATHAPAPKKKGGWGWLVWLLVILALLALLFWWWRCCERKKADEAAAKAKTEQVVTPAPVVPARAWSDVTLPDGTKIVFTRAAPRRR